ncbi:PilW family protein [Pseudomonadota bacterium]
MKITANKKSGFTLIELLVSMTIFIIFLGIVSSSYISIVRAQKEANDVRRIYSEMRTFVEVIAEEVRLSAIDYDCYEGGGDFVTDPDFCDPEVVGSLPLGRTNHLALIRKGGNQKSVFKFDEGKVYVTKILKTNGVWGYAPGYGGVGQDNYEQVLSDNIEVMDLSFYIYPDKNPYSKDHYANNAKQFQPKVTLFMSVRNAKNEDSKFEFDFQTTVSSRVYSRVI